jgi:hypothetical protein
MFSDNQFKCGYQRAFYICGGQAQAFVALQKAIDRLINQLPLFRPIEPAPGQSPIGTSKAGYDGIVGPTTSGLGLTALIGAFEVRREATGEINPPPAVAISMRESSEVARTKNFAAYAVELAGYLNDTASRFGDLLEAIRAKKKAREETSVFIEPPPLPLPLPVDIAMNFGRGKRLAKAAAWLLGGGLLVLGAVSLVKKGDRRGGMQELGPYSGGF